MANKWLSLGLDGGQKCLAHSSAPCDQRRPRPAGTLRAAADWLSELLARQAHSSSSGRLAIVNKACTRSTSSMHVGVTNVWWLCACVTCVVAVCGSHVWRCLCVKKTLLHLTSAQRGSSEHWSIQRRTRQYKRRKIRSVKNNMVAATRQHQQEHQQHTQR
jgi:hypothetical protein